MAPSTTPAEKLGACRIGPLDVRLDALFRGAGRRAGFRLPLRPAGPLGLPLRGPAILCAEWRDTAFA